MIVYPIVLLVLAATLLIWGSLLHKGKVNSIRAIHQRMAKDKVSYGKAMGKALFAMSFSQAAAGVIALLGEKPAFVIITVVISFAGMIAGVCCINKVQGKLLNGEF